MDVNGLLFIHFSIANCQRRHDRFWSRWGCHQMIDTCQKKCCRRFHGLLMRIFGYQTAQGQKKALQRNAWAQVFVRATTLSEFFFKTNLTVPKNVMSPQIPKPLNPPSLQIDDVAEDSARQRFANSMRLQKMQKRNAILHTWVQICSSACKHEFKNMLKTSCVYIRSLVPVTQNRTHRIHVW